MLKSCMTYIEGFDRLQTLLLPPAIDDFVGPDNPVRFINAFVDELDLEDAGIIRAQAKTTGRPGYHPGDLLKLYIYGYVNRIRSNRRLEAETHRNVEVMWLLRQLHPDFKTIADFRRDNRHAFKKVFRRIDNQVMILHIIECSLEDERICGAIRRREKGKHNICQL